MIYALGAVALYLLSIIWLGYVGPWIDEGVKDTKRHDAARDEAYRRRQEELNRREEERNPKSRREDPDKIGDFKKFVFPLIRRASPALIAPQIISVQPMTGPVGGIAFYRPRYGEEEELHTVLDDLIEALDEDDELDQMDPARRSKRIASQIVWEVFHDHPYSPCYGKPKPSLDPPSVKGPLTQTELPRTHSGLERRVDTLLQGIEATAASQLIQGSVLNPSLQKWSMALEGSSLTPLVTARLLEQCARGTI